MNLNILSHSTQLGKRKKLFLKLIFLLPTTIIIFYFLFSKISFTETIKIILDSNAYYLLLSLLVLLITLLCYILRWYLLIKKLSDKVTFKDAAISLMSALTLNSVLPSKLGDFFKIYYFRSNISKLIGAIFVERLLDLFSLILLVLICSVLLNNTLFIIIVTAILICLTILLLLLRYFKNKNLFKKYELLCKIAYSFNQIIHDPRHSIILLILSFISWLLNLLQIYFLFLALSISPKFIYFISAIVLVILISMLPITIAGMGTRESAILYFFSHLANPEVLLASGLLFSFFRYWFLSILGLPFFIYAFSKKSHH